MRRAILFLTMSFVFSFYAEAKNLYVPSDYKTIQLAVDAASDGDFILLSDGTYTGDGNLGVRIGNKDVTIKSLSGDSSRCIIDGEHKRDGFFIYKNKKIVTIDGITISNCYGAYGGAISIDDSYNVFLKNLTIRRCRSGMSGGGVYAINTISLNIDRCFFLYNETLVTGCGEVDGGGLASFSTNTNIVNSIFYQNKSKSFGGGVYFGGDKNLSIVNSNLIGNRADYAPVSEGGGLYFTHSKIKVVNSILRDNIAGFEGTAEIGPSYWVHRAQVTYSNIKGMDPGYGIGNMDADPLFMGPSSGDFRLQERSPCIDSGTSVGAPGVDMIGTARPCGRGYDIGAYEYCGLATGFLTVNIAPVEAVAGGAKWRIGSGSWQNSGTTMSLSPGSYLVEFSEVAGWTKPANQTATIIGGQAKTVTGVYTTVQNQGFLTVTITPDEVVNAGAKWRVGSGDWLDSAITLGLAPGVHTVEFSEVSGWVKPAGRAVAIAQGQTESLNGAYSRGYTYYLPYFESQGPVWTGLALSNFGVERVNEYVIQYFSSDGQLIGNRKEVMPPHSQRSFVADFNGNGWIKVQAEAPLTGLALIGDQDSSLLDLPAISNLGTYFSAPHISTAFGWDTLLCMCNAEEDQTSVVVEYFTPSGAFAASSNLVVSGSGSILQSMMHSFGPVNGGSLYIRSDRPMAGMVIFQDGLGRTAGFPLSIIK